MSRTSAGLISVIVVAGVLAVATAAGAQGRSLGPGWGYPPPPPGSPGWRETPMFAPDAPTPRNYNNPGLPDFQNGSRG